MSVGRFITFEGGEGAGKSTQLALLADRLRAAGVEVVTTREPGGTPGAEAIRTLLVDGGVERWAASTELLLVVAARDDHLRRLILPALARGAWVLCDRFVDSTRVYQGIAGGLGREQVDRLHDCALPTITPDLTVLLDLDPAAGLARRRAAGAGGRFERKGRAFHAQVRAGFRGLADAEPDRIAVVDAAASAEAVALAIWSMVAARLGLAA